MLLPTQEQGPKRSELPNRPEDRDRGRLAASRAFPTGTAEFEDRLLRRGPPFEGKVQLEPGERHPLQNPSREVVPHLKSEGNIRGALAALSPRHLLFLGVATFGSRLLLALYLGVWGKPETWEYDVIAANIAGGAGHTFDRSGFVYAAYSPPIWSYVLAFLLGLPGSTRANIQVLQALFCFGSAIIYAALARRMSADTTNGLLAGFLVALQPSLLYYSVVKSDPLPLNVLLLGLIALAAVELVRKPRLPSALGLGLLLALGVLARGTPIVALPLVAVWLVARWRGRAAVWLALAAGALALGLSPWLIRNERLLGRALITTTAGENFWRGNHQGATGGVADEDGGPITDLIPSNESLPGTIRSVLSSGTEADRQDVFLNEALTFIRENPLSAASLFARKMRTFWWRIDSDPRDYSPAAALAYEVIFRTELVLALFGAFTLFRSPRESPPAPHRAAAVFSIALMVAISVLQSMFYVQGRHRFLIEPLLLMFTACGILALIPGVVRGERRRRRSRRGEGPPPARFSRR